MLGVESGRETEIRELYVSPSVEEDVVGFDVSIFGVSISWG